MTYTIRLRNTALGALSCLFVLAAYLFTSGFVEPASGSQGDGALACTDFSINPAPARTVSGAWDPSGERLLLVDNVFDRILRYSSEGELSGGLPDFAAKSLELFTPRALANFDSSLLVKLDKARFVSFDRQFSPVGQLDLSRDAVRGDTQVTSAFQFTVAGDDLMTFSDLRTKWRESEQWQSGIVRIPFSEPSDFQVLETFSVRDLDTRVFYKLGFPYLASIGSKGFALLMREPVGIYVNEPGDDGLHQLENALPEFLRDREEVHYFRDETDFATTMEDIEESTMPVGLYGWQGFLYVLAREYVEDSTTWHFLKIDPSRSGSKIVAQSTLPTEANHLLAVPGPKQWAFVEMGSVAGFDKQEIESALLVPAPMIEDLNDGRLCGQAFRSGVSALESPHRSNEGKSLAPEVG